MPVKGWNPNPGNYIVLQCKTCGALIKTTTQYRRTMKIRCRSCKGTRFRLYKDPDPP